MPASKCGSYTLISTLIPTDFGVQTVSAAAIPDSPPTNVSPLHGVAKKKKKKKIKLIVFILNLFSSLD